MGDRPESDGTIWTPPKSAGDLKREYEEMGRDRDGLVEKALERCRSVIQTNIDFQLSEGFEPNSWDLEARDLSEAALAVVERERTDDPACSDPTCSYRAEVAFQRGRPLVCVECQGEGTVSRQHPGRDSAGLQLGTYRAECPRCEGEGKLIRPLLTKEEADYLADFVGEARHLAGPTTSYTMDHWNAEALAIVDAGLVKLRALASSTTEERYEAAERLRRRQDNPRTQERSLTAWREEDESRG